MINISLTDFVDYVSKVEPSKYTKVKTIKGRDDYAPYKDFWKPLREAIIDLHKDNLERDSLDEVLGKVASKKQELYQELIKQYKSFLGRKKIEWFDPPFKEWKYDDLRVTLNPEMGLEINGTFYVIKLYFKAEKLTQSKADLILLLLNERLKKRNYKDVVFAILDIPRKKLFEKTKLRKEHLALLEGEAESFIKIWNSLG